MYWWVFKINFKNSVCREKREVISDCSCTGEDLGCKGPHAAGLPGLGLPASPLYTPQPCPLAGNASFSALHCPCGDTRHIPELSRKQSCPFLHPAHLCKGLSCIFFVCLARWESTLTRMKWNRIVFPVFLIHNPQYFLSTFSSTHVSIIRNSQKPQNPS